MATIKNIKENIYNINLRNEEIKENLSKKDVKFWTFLLGDYEFLVSPKFIIGREKGISIGIINTFEYPILNTQTYLLGKDVINYHQELLKESK